MIRKNKLVCPLILCFLTIIIFVGCSSPKTPADLYPTDMESFYVNTSYGTLEFPEKWEKYIVSEIITEGDTEVVQYWVEIGDYDKVHIFDIVFAGEGYYVGSIIKDNGQKIDVRVVSYDVELGDDWLDEDVNTVYAIVEDLNFLLVKLNNIQGFESV